MQTFCVLQGGADSLNKAKIVTEVFTRWMDQATSELMTMNERKRFQDCKSWERVRINCPQQTNGYDCGVFTSAYMSYVGQGYDLTYTQDGMDAFRSRLFAYMFSQKTVDLFKPL